MTRMTLDEVTGTLADALSRVARNGERIVFQHNGKEVAVLIPVEDLALLEEKEDRADYEEALRVLNDPDDEAIPCEQAWKELGLA